ncbi:FMN-binding protein MioC [Colwelliaceae bacterium 6471]
MASIQIIVGSMLGGTEYVAEACEEILSPLGHQITIHFQPHFEQISFHNQVFLICTSTHGAGDYPDNIKEFVEDLTNSDQDLSSTKFMIIGIGDSSYDTFCQAAKNIEKLLISKCCMKINDTLLIDMSLDIDPEELAQAWITQQQDLL